MHSLVGTSLDTGLDPASLSGLSSFWEHTRALYAPFESDMKSPSTDVYQHEMPGGQYTNLKFQVRSSLLSGYCSCCAPWAAVTAHQIQGQAKMLSTPAASVVAVSSSFLHLGLPFNTLPGACLL